MLYLGERLANALAYVHERGVLHRDLKPTNVLLCPNGEPVLIDFNLALDRSMTEHRLGGTLPYMPPEQLEAMSKDKKSEPVPADNRSDIFALGVILYELLTGTHPFGPVPLKLKTAEARDFLIERQRRGPLSLRSRNRSIDPAVERLVLRCLSADPTGRPATAKELAAELRRLLAPASRARRWVASHIRLVAMAGALVVSAAGAAGYAATLPGPAEVHRQKAEAHYRNGEFNAAVEEFTESLNADWRQADVYFARGRALQKSGKLRQAAQDFEAAHKAGDQRAAASAGYCLALLRDHHKAVPWFRQALQSGDSAELHNDLAFSLLRRGDNGNADYVAAEEQATEAIRRDPALRAAYYNRAFVRLKLWRVGQGAGAIEGLGDARMAISLGDDRAFLYWTAAALAAAELKLLGQPVGDPLEADGLDFLNKAVACGYPPKDLPRNFQLLPSLADWSKRLTPIDGSQTVTCSMDDEIRLIDPFMD